MNNFVYLRFTKMWVNINTIECIDINSCTFHFIDNNELKVFYSDMVSFLKELSDENKKSTKK